MAQLTAGRRSRLWEPKKHPSLGLPPTLFSKGSSSSETLADNFVQALGKAFSGICNLCEGSVSKTTLGGSRLFFTYLRGYAFHRKCNYCPRVSFRSAGHKVASFCRYSTGEDDRVSSGVDDPVKVFRDDSQPAVYLYNIPGTNGAVLAWVLACAMFHKLCFLKNRFNLWHSL